VLDLHRFLGALSIIFLGVHLAALVADDYTHFGPAALFVPLASRWRPGPVAWGVVALYLVVAIEMTSLVKRHLPERVWHSVHLMSLPVFVIATVHGLSAGADAHNAVVQWLALTCATGVAFLLVFRLLTLRARRAERSRRLGGLATTSARRVA
jgi:hypothetical protein